jgi:hypothetical protein
LHLSQPVPDCTSDLTPAPQTGPTPTLPAPQTIVAMRRRFAQPAATKSAPELWTMTPDQAERLATAASDTKIAIQGLLFRLRWSKVYEEGILNGESAADIKMMTINQERFEDDPTPDSQKP